MMMIMNDELAVHWHQRTSTWLRNNRNNSHVRRRNHSESSLSTREIVERNEHLSRSRHFPALTVQRRSPPRLSLLQTLRRLFVVHLRFFRNLFK